MGVLESDLILEKEMKQVERRVFEACEIVSEVKVIWWYYGERYKCLGFVDD